jgi:hypothetical protein
MKTIYKYHSHSEKLISELEMYKDDVPIGVFLDKYKIWWAFFEEVLTTSEKFVSPKIHSLVATSKIVALCGMAEGFIKSGDKPQKKFEKFLGYLNPEEKLLFSLAFSSKKSTDVEALNLEDKYNKTGDNTYFEKLIALTTRNDDFYHEQINNIMKCFIGGDLKLLDDFYKSKLDLLYGIRSKIVHEGSPNVVAAMLSSSTEAIMFYGNRTRSEFFTIRYPLEEFFIRAAYRACGHSPVQLDPTEFLWDEFTSQHAPYVAIIANKIRQK